MSIRKGHILEQGKKDLHSSQYVTDQDLIPAFYRMIKCRQEKFYTINH